MGFLGTDKIDRIKQNKVKNLTLLARRPSALHCRIPRESGKEEKVEYVEEDSKVEEGRKEIGGVTDRAE